MISTPPPPPQIPTFHYPSLCMSRPVPSPLLIHNSTFQNQNQPAMIHSLPCKVLFLTRQGPAPTCHHPFLTMSSSGPPCNVLNLRTSASSWTESFHSPFHLVLIGHYTRSAVIDHLLLAFLPNSYLVNQHLIFSIISSSSSSSSGSTSSSSSLASSVEDHLIGQDRIIIVVEAHVESS